MIASPTLPSDQIHSFDGIQRRLMGARSTFGLAHRLSDEIDGFGDALRRNPMLGSVRGRMPATSLTSGQSISVDDQTLRSIRPLGNGSEWNVTERLVRGPALADMMVALAGVSMLGLPGNPNSQNNAIQRRTRGPATGNGPSSPGSR